MSNQLLSSKITVEEESPAIRTIPTVSTFVMGFLGTAKQGPVGTATLVNSFAEFIKVFGSYYSGSDLVNAVEGFFNNGGSSCYIVRTVHYTDITDASTRTSALGTVAIVDSVPATTLTINGKYEGAYTAGLKIVIGAATSGTAAEFNLSVTDSTGLVLEVYPNLSMTTTAARFVEKIVNDPTTGSFRIAAVAVKTTRPVNITTAVLAGGADGVSSIADVDYTGSAASATGLRAFDVVDGLTVIAVPGLATSAIHNAMITYCESTRGGQIEAILDPPAATAYAAMVTYVNTTAAIGGLSEFGAIYWPRIKVANPLISLYGNGTDITVPPSGHIAGMIARNDNAKPGGVWTNPAGTEEGKLFGVTGFETLDTLKEDVRDVLFPQRINPITTMAGFPRFVDGARTLKGDGNFPSLGQRRGVSFVERSIKLGLQFARHKNNTPTLRATLERSVRAFLKSQMDVGAYASTDPKTAFFVDFGPGLNPPQQKNQIIGRIGQATVEPAEFIRLRFSQDTRAIDAALKA